MNVFKAIMRNVLESDQNEGIPEMSKEWEFRFSNNKELQVYP